MQSRWRGSQREKLVKRAIFNACASGLFVLTVLAGVSLRAEPAASRPTEPASVGVALMTRDTEAAARAKAAELRLEGIDLDSRR